MIYRHYKGSLYLVKGYAVYIEYIKDYEKILGVLKVQHTESNKEFAIYHLQDTKSGGTYYAYLEDEYKQDGGVVFYYDTYSKLWARPQPMFSGQVFVEEGFDGLLYEAESNSEHGFFVQRFVPLDNERLFMIIASEMRKKI